MQYIVMMLLYLFSVLGFHSVYAEEKKSEKGFSEESISILPSGAIHEGDYFAFGNTVEISGRVTGDIYAIGSQIVIDGEVDGDLLAIGGSIHVSGIIGHNIRIIAGQATISGIVQKNATIAAANLQIVPSASIQGNLVGTVANADVGGAVRGEATIVASNLRVCAKIDHTLHAYVGHLRITSKGFIGGDLEYDSDHEANIEPGAKILGTITYHPSVLKEVLKGHFLNFLLIGSKLTGVLMNFLYCFVVGWIWLKLYPQNLERALNALTHKPLKAFAYGLILLILLPLASLIFLMTILGAPFAITLLALNVIGFYTAKVLTIFWASNKFFKKIGLKPNTLPIFSFGLICYFLLAAIPFFGSLFAFVAMIFGLGAVPLAKVHQRQLHP